MNQFLLQEKIRNYLVLIAIMVVTGVCGQTTIFSENMGTPSTTTAIASNVFQNGAPIAFSGDADVRNNVVSSVYAGASGGGNVFITSTVGRQFVISGINTSGYTNLSLSLGHHKSTTTGSNELVIEVSDNGTSYSPLSYTRTTGSGTASWTLITPSGTIPSTSNLRIRFRQTSGSTQFRVDDVKLTGTLAPTVTTGTASAISASGATLNGSINANGGTTAASFQYGTSVSYGQTATASPSSVTGSTTTDISAAISGLSPNTQYFFRAVGGAVNGSGSSFYTLAAVPGAPALSEATPNSIKVSLSGAENGNPAETTYIIRVGSLYVQADGTLGASAVAQTVAQWGTVTVIGLSAETEYTVDVAAVNQDAIQTAFGTSAALTTLSASSPSVTIESTLSAFGDVCPGATSVESFQFSAANLNGTSLFVEVDGASPFRVSLDGSSWTTSIEYNAAGTISTQTIFVRFAPVGTGSFGESIEIFGGGVASTVTVSASGTSTVTIPQPLTLGSTAVGSTTATVQGSIVATTCAPVLEYGVVINGTNYPSADANVTSGTFNVALTGLAAATTYTYTAYIITASGTTLAASGDSFTTSAIAAPVAIAATNVGSDNFTANWEVVSGASSYRLDVSTNPNFQTVTNSTDLIISEYVEGSSNNKYIELYNGTGATVDLSQYAIALHTNGAVTPQTPVTLSGTLASGATVLYRNGSANLLGTTGIINGAMNFNGNDPVTLLKNGEAVDRIGTLGVDVNFGADVTLRRKSSVINPNLTFNAADWDSFPQNTSDGLGVHTMNNVVASFLPGYENLTVNGTSQEVTGLSEATTYYYRVRSFSSTSTSTNSNVISVTTASQPATFGAITQVAGVVCSGSTATFNVTGLLANSTNTISFNIGGGSTQTVADVVANASGFASFDWVVTTSDNGQTLTVTSVERTDIASAPVTVSENNTVVISVNANSTYYADADGDGFGDAATSIVACELPEGYVTNDQDCDDTAVLYEDLDGDGFGSAIKVACNGVDNDDDCDDSVILFGDFDNDGFGGANIVACGGVAQPGDCDDTRNTVFPGATEIGYNLIDDDCDGQIDEGFPPIVSNIGGSFCNTTLSTIDQIIQSTLVAGAQGYQWRVTTVSGPNVGQVQLLNTPLRAMKLTQLANYAYNATYKIEVAVYYQGFLQPYNGNSCNVTTPTAVSQLINCDQTLSNINDIISASRVNFATGYRFRVTDPVNPANTVELDRVLREFRMSQITSFAVQYNKMYTVEVAVRNTDGSYLPYGPACSVTTPVFPTVGLLDAQCDDYQVPSMTTQIFAASYPGAIGYAFKLTGPGLVGGTAEVVKPLRVFTLNDFASFGLVPGAAYNVQVRLIFNSGDAPGLYGKTCTIIVPGAARVKAVDFNAVASPNPFAENFNIDLTTSTQEPVMVKVYDMAGRLLEERSATVSGTETTPLGDRYPAGVYNVIVTQGDEVKALRVIKR